MDHDVFELYLIAIGSFSVEDICQFYISDLLFKILLEGTLFLYMCTENMFV